MFFGVCKHTPRRTDCRQSRHCGVEQDSFLRSERAWGCNPHSKGGFYMEFEKIRDVIAEQMSISKESITESTTFKNDLNADSLDIFQIISELEEIFGMEFANEDAENIRTVGDAANYVKKALS